MKFLVVADDYPWPARSGYRQRLHWVVRTLAGLGTVDLLVVRDEPLADPPNPPSDVRLGRTEVVTAGYAARSSVSRALRWLLSARPRRLVGQDWAPAREAVQRWAEDEYDLVWFAHSPTYLALRDRLPAPHVVDLDNLESSMAHLRRLGRGRRSSPRSLPRHLASAAADLLDERLWERVEERVAGAARVTVVCSELDRGRLAGPRVAVLSNGYELPDRPGGAPAPPPRSVTGGPVLLFVGLLTYEPNRDAVAFFAQDVLPLIRVHRPDVRFRVVGHHGADLVAAVSGRGVELAGEVPDVTAELAGADLVVVPLRFGGGTRIKVLEAFAHGVPVVSTRVGCEGLDVEDGRHVLLADDPRALADSCLRLLDDADRGAVLSSHARELWQRQYRWTVIAPTVDGIVRAAVGRADPEGRGPRGGRT
ncbi:glycosyltransferase [Modestobacter excelsi]|uniref:glycosyltransferase n=1 Tax=Modestobacter excelsi TaxID=2213161 RepID=UPI00110C9CA0|nr:glycosyltransferase family 4 protein [Modestobacter excelsi]